MSLNFINENNKLDSFISDLYFLIGILGIFIVIYIIGIITPLVNFYAGFGEEKTIKKFCNKKWIFLKFLYLLIMINNEISSINNI